MKAEQFAFNDQATKQGTMNLQKMDIFGMVNQPFNTFWCSQRVRVGCDPDNLRPCDCIGHTITHPGWRVIQLIMTRPDTFKTNMFPIISSDSVNTADKSITLALADAASVCGHNLG